MQTELFTDTVTDEPIEYEYISFGETSKGHVYVEYTFENIDGRTFGITGPDLEWCQNKKNQWLLATEQGEPCQA